MNKQQKTYGLLLAVLIIWGIIGYQIYVRLNPPSPELSTTKYTKSFIRQEPMKSSFYEVKVNYRDPFLGGFPIKRVVNKRTIKPKPTTPFPTIIYNGIIEGNSTKSYILTINDSQEILKLGQESQEVKLISANTKNAVVKFQGVKKTILLQ